MVNQWIRILKVIYDNGGEASTTTIANGIGESNPAIHSAAEVLKIRGFLKKRKERKLCDKCPGLHRKKTYWIILESRKSKVAKILSKAYGENYE